MVETATQNQSPTASFKYSGFQGPGESPECIPARGGEMGAPSDRARDAVVCRCESRQGESQTLPCRLSLLLEAALEGSRR